MRYAQAKAAGCHDTAPEQAANAPEDVSDIIEEQERKRRKKQEAKEKKAGGGFQF